MSMGPEAADWSVAGLVAMGGTLLGWAVRSLSLASRWGAVQVELSGLRNELHEFKGAFHAHLAQDVEDRRHLDSKLSGLSRDLNQLIGAQGGRGGGGEG